MTSKKKRPTTLIFTVVILILAGLTALDYWRTKGKEDLGEGERKVVEAKEDQITSVSIVSPRQTTEVRKNGPKWQIEKPIHDDADDTSVSSFLTSLVSAKVQKVQSDDDNASTVDWKKFGLDPGVLFQLTPAEGKKQNFSVSETNAFDGSFYLRLGDQLFLGDKSWAHIADKSAASLRTKQIWRSEGEVTGAVLTFDDGAKYSLLKSDAGWTLKPAGDLPLSTERVSAWITAVQGLEATEIAQDHPSKEDLEKDQLTKPSVQLEFALTKDGQTSNVTWKIGQDRGEDVFLESSAIDAVYKLRKSALKEVRVRPEQFFDGKAALRFPIEQARSLHLTKDGQKFDFVKTDKDWVMKPASSEPFNSASLVDLIQKIEALEPVVETLPANLQFHSEMNQLVVKSDSKTLLEMEWSPEQNHFRWIKNPAYKERFKVSAASLSAVLSVSFTKPKTDGKAPDKK